MPHLSPTQKEEGGVSVSKVGNRRIAGVLTVILVLGFVLGVAGSASAGRLKNDETVDLTYKKGKIKCVVRWSYEYSKVASYDITVWRQTPGFWEYVDSTDTVLRKPAAKGRVSYEVAATSGYYYFQVVLPNEYGGNMTYPDNVDHYIAVP
jgi:hypothetical protein